MRRAHILLAAAALAAALPACTHRGAAPPPAGKPSPQTAADAIYAEGAAYLLAGKPDRALELFAEAWKSSPGHAGVLQDYGEALAALRKGADDAYRNGRYDEAGRSWTELMRHMGHPAARGQAAFTKAEIQGRIDRLTAMLLERAIVDYRQGNLEGAIASWKAILSYDPHHKEAAQSVKTAAKQLENLRKIPRPSR